MVVVILDNNSQNQHCITTKTGADVYMESSIITPLRLNKSLRNKPVLLITQKLASYSRRQSSRISSKARQQLQQLSSNIQEKNISRCKRFMLNAWEKSSNFLQSSFIEASCNEILRNFSVLPIADIFTNIQRQANSSSLSILVEASCKKLVFGLAADYNVLRDFF